MANKQKQILDISILLTVYMTNFRFMEDFQAMHPLDKTEKINKIAKEILKAINKKEVKNATDKF